MESKIMASVRRPAATAAARDSRSRLRHLAAATASVLAIGLLPSGISVLTSAAAASGPAATAVHNPFVRAVSCVTARRCVAVGSYQSGTRILPLAWTWNGRTWNLQRVPLVPGDSGGLDAVTCHSPAACTAVGQSFRAVGAFVSGPLVERWNGRSWAVQRTARPLPAGGSILTGVSCTSAAACTAVGYSEFDEEEAGLPLVERWNGRRWAFQRAPGDHGDTLAAVSCASARSCTAVGTSARGDAASPLAEHWNGRRWTLQQMPASPSGGFSGLSGVSCPVPRACAAVGTSADIGGSMIRMLAEHWNGRQWAVQHVDNVAGLPLSRLSGVSCPVPTACAAVGTSGNFEQPQVALAGWWNGKNWVVQRVASPAGAAGGSLDSVSCRSARMCMAVGYYQDSRLSDVPESARWNGVRWVIAPLPVHFPRAPRR
jgi:hypothetical protein